MTPTNPNRRTEIIDAAERRFASQGYLETSVSEIIGDAGIAKGTFYHYFQSKESVMYAVIDKNVALLKSQVESYMAESTQPPLAQFTMILGGGFAPRRPETTAISTELEQDGNELMHMRAIDATIKALIPPLADLLERAATSGDIDCPNPDAAAAAVLVFSAQLLDRDLLGWVKTRNIAAIRDFGVVAERVIGAPTGTFTPIVDSFIASLP